MTERVLVKSNLRRSYTYSYRCAVNVSGHPDHYCGWGASDHESGGVRPNTAKDAAKNGLKKEFENHNGAKNYPMYALAVHWSDGVSQTARFRGYDTCVKARSTKLCAKSGNGS